MNCAFTWAKLHAWFPASKSNVVPLFLISVNGATVYPAGQTKSLRKQKSGHAIVKPSMGFLSFLGEKKKKIKGFPKAQRCHTLPLSFLFTPFHPRLSPCSSDTCTSCTSGPLHLFCLPKILYPQDIRLAHSLDTLLKCYLLKEVFSDHPSTTYVFLSLKYVYMGIIYLIVYCLSAPTRM